MPPPQQILTHSRVRDGIWLTPENLREVYTGLKADKDNNGKENIFFDHAHHYLDRLKIVLEEDHRNTCSYVLCRVAESRGVQAPEQWRIPAFSNAAGGKEEPAGEEQQTHVAVSGKGSTPSAAGHQGEVGHVVIAPEAQE